MPGVVEELTTHGDRVVLIRLLGQEQVAVVVGVATEREFVGIPAVIDQLGGILVPVPGLTDEVQRDVHQRHFLFQRRGLAAQLTQALAQDHVGVRQAQQVFRECFFLSHGTTPYMCPTSSGSS